MTPKAVIFDCDGVLVDSESMTFDLLSVDFAQHGLHLSPGQIAQDFIGGTMAGVANLARAKGADLPIDWVATFYDKLYAHLAMGTPLVPGILDLLDRLDTHGIPYAVGSNGSDEKMQITLGQHPGLIARFGGRLFSGQTIGRPKPAPDLYLYAAQVLGCDVADCCVIEDSATGCAAAKAAGIACYGYAAHDDGLRLQNQGAIVFKQMSDLIALLQL